MTATRTIVLVLAALGGILALVGYHGLGPALIAVAVILLAA